MDKLIALFPAQLREALEIGKQATLRQPDRAIYKSLAAGMGGSGIGANFVAEWIAGESPLPYASNKGYQLPAYVDAHTLGICSSYSGNTEETLDAFEQMKQSGAWVVCVTSGGKLLQMAQEAGYDCVALPGGYSSPRACLGYSAVAQLAVFVRLGLVSSARLEEVARAADLLEKEQETIREKAEILAGVLVDTTPVIYASEGMEPVAVRFRQQLNENSKMLAWHNLFPELNHNELVGWRRQRPDLSVVYLRSAFDHPRNQRRLEISQEIVAHFCSTNVEIIARGESRIEQSLYLVHLTDWVSWYLAQKQGIDAVEIKVIDFLKEELGKG